MEAFQFEDEIYIEEDILAQAENSAETLKVHDVMSQEPIKIYQDDSTESALRIMQWEGLLHACVFNDDNKLIGVLNYADLLVNRSELLTVKSLMHYNFHKIYGELDAQVGKEAVLNEPDFCMPVFEDRKIIGILSVEDFLAPSKWN